MIYPLQLHILKLICISDDSTVKSTAKTTEKINGHLNTDMKEITKWCVENRMSANARKTKSMLITTWRKRLSLPENLINY